jgi:hypothetical protein
MKVRKRKSFYVLDYLLELIIKNIAIWIYFSLKSGQFGLDIFEIIFFRFKFCKILSNKERLSIEKVVIVLMKIRPNLAINHI